MTTLPDHGVQAAFDAFSDRHRAHLLRLRALVLQVGDELDTTGGVVETLKWGEPSYLPRRSRVGSTLRLGVHDADHVALYVNCQTTLIESFHHLFGPELTYAGSRAVLFDVSHPLPEAAVRQCARRVFEYHVDKRR